MNMISERLKTMRERKNYSQEGIAPPGMKQRTVSDWERGNIPQALIWIGQIADRLDTSADYLLGLTDEPNSKNPLDSAEGVLVERIRLLSPGHQRIISGMIVVLLAEQRDRRAIYRRLVEEYMRLLSDDDGDSARA